MLSLHFDRRLSAALLAAMTCLAPMTPAAAQVEHDINVTAEAVPLAPGNPAITRIGRLEYRGGLALASPDAAFGGFSGIVVNTDGSEFLAISDRGHWWTGRLYYRDGWLADIDDNTIAPMADNGERPVVGLRADAEAITVDSGGSAYVAFERDHRIVRYFLSDRESLRSILHAYPSDMPTLAPLKRAPFNGGVEALALAGHNVVLAVSEESTTFGGNRAGWLIYHDLYAPVSYPVRQDYSPVDFAALPNGDILSLERYYTPFTGSLIRLCIVPRDTIKPGQLMGCDPIAEIRRPLTVDNFEGVAVRRSEAGELFVYLVSDDNFNPAQRTLLMMFKLVED